MKSVLLVYMFPCFVMAVYYRVTFLHFSLKHSENCKTLPREHPIGFQSPKMFLFKDIFFLLKFRYVTQIEWSQFGIFEFRHNLSFVTFWVLSQLDFLSCQLKFWSFVTIWVEFCHHLSWVLSPFEFLNLLTIWVEFHHNLSLSFLVHNFFCKKIYLVKLVFFVKKQERTRP